MNALVSGILADAYVVNREQLAYHEIGHAVIAARLGRQILCIEVGHHGGMMRSEGAASPLILLLVSLGGARAELLAPGCMPELIGFGPGRDEQDIERALDLIAAGPTDREWIREDAIREVDKVLLEQRDRLDHIARMLLRRGTLEGRELRGLLQ